jgi:hypothetical protein
METQLHGTGGTPSGEAMKRYPRVAVRSARSGTLMAAYVFSIPLVAVLFLMTLTRIDIMYAETQRTEHHTQTRWLAESALVVLQNQLETDALKSETGWIGEIGVWKIAETGRLNREERIFDVSGAVDGHRLRYTSRYRISINIPGEAASPKTSILDYERRIDPLDSPPARPE